MRRPQSGQTGDSDSGSLGVGRDERRVGVKKAKQTKQNERNEKRRSILRKERKKERKMSGMNAAYTRYRYMYRV